MYVTAWDNKWRSPGSQLRNWISDILQSHYQRFILIWKIITEIANKTFFVQTEMAMLKPGFFAMSECIEWTAHVPKVDEPATRSPSFAFERKECHLKLYFESKSVSYVELCLVNKESPFVPFDVSVFVTSATKSLRSERITVRNTSESIWSCRWSDVQIYLKDFCISLMINFHRSKNETGKNSVICY